MKRVLLGVAAAAALAFAGSDAEASNLLTNGSFETGDFTGWINNSGNQFVTQAPTDGLYAEDGTSFAAFGAFGSDGTLSQGLGDTAGQTLILSYFRMSDGSAPNDFSVAWDGKTIAGSVLVDSPDQRGSGYVHYVFAVEATGADTLTFSGRNDNNLDALDNVSLTPAGGNLLTNGSFETGDFTGWTNGSGNQFVAQAPTDGLYAEDGTWFAALGAFGADGALSQAVTDPAGLGLTLSYYRMSDGSAPNDFSVAWDGVTIPGSVLVDSPDQRGSGYVHYVFNVTGTGSDTLTFSGRNDNNLDALDNVSLITGNLSAAPEPGEWVLVLLGVGLIGGALRAYGRLDRELESLRA